MEFKDKKEQEASVQSSYATSCRIIWKYSNIRPFPFHSGSEKEPAPNEYNRDSAHVMTARTAPAYTHGLRLGGTRLWSSHGIVFND